MALAFALALPALCEAQPSDDDLARSHFRAGEGYFQQARYEDAAREFRKAYELSGRTDLLLNESAAWERALELDRAIDALEQYFEDEPNPKSTGVLRKRLEHLRKLAKRRKREDESTSEASQKTPSETTAERSSRDTGASGPPAKQPAGGEDSGLGTMAIAGIASGALGVAAGAVAIGTGVAAHNQHGDLESQCGEGGRFCPAGSASDIDRGKALATSSTALTFVSIGAVAAGLTLFLLDDGTSPPGERARVGFGVGPNTIGASGSWSF